MGITLEGRDSIDLYADRSEQTACVVVRVDRALCEIRIQQAHVERLRDQVPGVLGVLDRVAAEETACRRAEAAGERAAQVEFE